MGAALAASNLNGRYERATRGLFGNGTFELELERGLPRAPFEKGRYHGNGPVHLERAGT
jgi:hypothetical protein